jgi:hypothetical protein
MRSWYVDVSEVSAWKNTSEVIHAKKIDYIADHINQLRQKLLLLRHLYYEKQPLEAGSKSQRACSKNMKERAT